MRKQASCPGQHLPVAVDNRDVCQEMSLKPAAAAAQFHCPGADAVWALLWILRAPRADACFPVQWRCSFVVCTPWCTLSSPAGPQPAL